MTHRPKALNVKQAAYELGIPEGSVRRLIRNGDLAAVKLGRYYVVPVTEIDRLVELATAERRAS